MSSIKQDTIIVDRKNDQVIVKPIQNFYKFRQIQIELDSAFKREVYYKEIIKQKDELISIEREDNKQLKETLIKVEPELEKTRETNKELTKKNKSLKLSIGVAIIAVITQTIFLLK